MPVTASVSGACLSLYSAMMEHRATFKIPRILYRDFLYAFLGERRQDQMLLSIIAFRVLRKAAIKTGVIGSLSVLLRYYANVSSRVTSNLAILSRLEQAEWRFYRIPFTDRVEILSAAFSATLITCRYGDVVDANGALIGRTSAEGLISNMKCIGYDALCAEYYLLGNTNYLIKVSFEEQRNTVEQATPTLNKLPDLDPNTVYETHNEDLVFVESIPHAVSAPVFSCDPSFNVVLAQNLILTESVDAYITETLEEETLSANTQEPSSQPLGSNSASPPPDVDNTSDTEHSARSSSYYAEENQDYSYQDSNTTNQSISSVSQSQLKLKVDGQYSLATRRFRRKLLNERFFSFYGRILAGYIDLPHDPAVSGLLLNFYSPMINRDQIKTFISSLQSAALLSTEAPSQSGEWIPASLASSAESSRLTNIADSAVGSSFASQSSSSSLAIILESGLCLLDLAVTPQASYLYLIYLAIFTSVDVSSFAISEAEAEFYGALRESAEQGLPSAPRCSLSIGREFADVLQQCDGKSLARARSVILMLLVDAFPDEQQEIMHYLDKTYEYPADSTEREKRRSAALNLGAAAAQREEERAENRGALIQQLEQLLGREAKEKILCLIAEMRDNPVFNEMTRAKWAVEKQEPPKKRTKRQKQQAASQATSDTRRGADTPPKTLVPVVSILFFANEAELDNYIRFLELQAFHYALSEIVAFYVSASDNKNIYIHRSFSQQREKFLSRYDPIFNLLETLSTDYRGRVRETRREFTTLRNALDTRFMPEHAQFICSFPYYYWDMQSLPLQDVTLAALWSFMRIWEMLDPVTSEAGESFLNSVDGRPCEELIMALIQELGIKNPEFLNPGESDVVISDGSHNSNSSADSSSKDSEYIPADSLKRQIKVARYRRNTSDTSSDSSYNSDSSS